MQAILSNPFCLAQGTQLLSKPVFLQTMLDAAVADDKLLMFAQELLNAGPKAGNFLASYRRGDWEVKNDFDQVIARLGMCSFLKDDTVQYILRNQNKASFREFLSENGADASMGVVVNFVVELTTTLCLNAQRGALYEEKVERAHFKAIIRSKLCPVLSQYAEKIAMLNPEYLQKLQQNTELLQKHFVS